MAMVLLVDALPVVRCGLRALIRESDPSMIIAEAASGAEAVQMVRFNVVDAVVLGIDLPGRDGLTTLGQIRKAFAHPPPVLVFSRHPERDYGLRALRGGPWGSCTRPQVPIKRSKPSGPS